MFVRKLVFYPGWKIWLSVSASQYRYFIMHECLCYMAKIIRQLWDYIFFCCCLWKSKGLHTLNCMHNEVWGYTEIEPNRLKLLHNCDDNNIHSLLYSVSNFTDN